MMIMSVFVNDLCTIPQVSPMLDINQSSDATGDGIGSIPPTGKAAEAGYYTFITTLCDSHAKANRTQAQATYYNNTIGTYTTRPIGSHRCVHMKLQLSLWKESSLRPGVRLSHSSS
jgi:hypothetical protein